MAQRPQPESTRRRPTLWRRLGWRAIALAAVLTALAVAAATAPAGDALEALVRWTATLGWFGPVALAAIYAAATVAMVPGAILTLAAGAIFGLPVGLVVVWTGATAGAAGAFLLGRTIARDAVARRLRGRERFEAVDRAVGREGFKIVLLTRLSPMIPFNLQNYAYGLTQVSFGRYLLASWLGMLPGTLAYVYLGAAAGAWARAATGRGERTPLEWALLAAGLVASAVAAVVIARIARRALRRRAPGAAEAEEPEARA